MEIKTIKDAAARIEALEEALTQAMLSIQELKAAPVRGKRDYGPKAENAMTDQMAWRIRYGDLVGAKVKDIANDNGLSRGQVYSVRGNYTFTNVKPESFYFNDDDGEIEILPYIAQ